MGMSGKQGKSVDGVHLRVDSGQKSKIFRNFFMFQNDPKRFPKSPTPHISPKFDRFHPFLIPFRGLR